jgi:hypothetical protein
MPKKRPKKMFSLPSMLNIYLLNQVLKLVALISLLMSTIGFDGLGSATSLGCLGKRVTFLPSFLWITVN